MIDLRCRRRRRRRVSRNYKFYFRLVPASKTRIIHPLSLFFVVPAFSPNISNVLKRAVPSARKSFPFFDKLFFFDEQSDLIAIVNTVTKSCSIFKRSLRIFFFAIKFSFKRINLITTIINLIYFII